MRLLLSTDTVGGVWTYSVELAAALAAEGVEVTLAALGRPTTLQRGEAAAAGVAALESQEFALEWMPDAAPDVEASEEWLRELAARHRADVVHVCSFAHGALDVRAAVVLVAHSDVCSWWRATYGREAPPEWERYRGWVARGLAAADAVVAPSAAAVADLRLSYGFAGDAQVIANGSAVPAGDPAAPREPFVLAAGRLWDPAKNLAALDVAVAGSEIEVRVAGELRDVRARNVVPLGLLPRAELARLGRRAALYAAPARYEPFGLAPLEAARGGCALVLGDIVSLREVWEDAAVYVDPDDPAALRAALEELLGDDERRRALARAAARRSREYSLARMAAAYRHLYARLGAAAPTAGAPA